MRLLEADIRGFGQYRNRTIRFDSGLNLIHGANESGKTTLMKFIEGMLYGFSKPVSAQPHTEDLERFRPWSGGPYGGCLIYECGGRRIAVDRDFAADTVRVKDADSGEDLTERMIQNGILQQLLPGGESFTISPAAFRNTISVIQGAASADPSSIREELEESLDNLTSSGDEDLSVRRSLERLRTQLDRIGAADNEGELGKLAAREQELTLNLRSAHEILERRERILGELDAIPDVVEDAEDAAWVVQRAGNPWQRNYLQELDQQIEEHVREQDESRMIPAGTDQEYENLIELRMQEKEARSRYGEAFVREQACSEEIGKLREPLDPPYLPPIPRQVWIWLVAGTILVAGGVIGYLLTHQFRGFVALVPGIVMLVVAVSIFLRHRREHKAILDEASAGEADRLNRLSAEERRLADCKEEQEQIRAALSQYTSRMDQLLQQAGVATIDEYRDRLQQSRSAGELADRIAHEQQEKDGWLIRTANDILRARRELLEERLAAIPAVPDAEQMQRELTEVSKRKEALQLERSSLLAASSAIESLSREIRREYGPALARLMNHTVSEVTGGRYNRVSFTEEGELRVTSADGHDYGIENLSAGTGDQIYMALRLAMVDVLSREEKLPLILDDAFARYDEERLLGMLRLLSAEAGRRQILIFSCQTREQELLGRHKIAFSMQTL